MYDNLPVDVRPEPGDVILVIDHEQSLGDPIPHIEGHLDQLKSRNYRHSLAVDGDSKLRKDKIHC